jgi:Ca-activated chloride channel homolog
MNRGRLVVILLALGAVAVAIVASGGNGGSKKGGGSAAKPRSGDTRITFLYSPEKEVVVKSLVDRFNREDHGIFVDARNVSSGDAETKIATGRLKPDAWSPASSLWGRLLNHEADKPWVPKDNPSLFRTPLVIAMWEPLARALGWPRKEVGFADILKLAVDQRGWAAYGKPQFGQFKLGHTNPDFSTSGLSAVAGEYYAATGKREGLTVADVERPEVRRAIRQVERSIVHYGATTPFFAQQLRRYGSPFAQAVAMEEATLIEFNRKPRGERLVALYPSDGTFFSDNPVAVLRAAWVTPALRDAGDAFSRWIRERATPRFVARFGFRPGDPSAKPGPPIDRAHGADPSQPEISLQLPQPAVLSRIKAEWRTDRKPANVMLVVDTSASMGEEDKMAQAKRGLQVFFRQLAPQDRVGLVEFSSKSRQVLPIARFSATRDRLMAKVRAMIPDGETALYEATKQGVDAVRTLNDPTRINAVVLLTDGENTTGEIDSQTLIEALRSHSPVEEKTVRVFTIAYGGDAASGPLKEIADATGGQAFTGDPNRIAAVYQSISSFF